jgi:hypothetical protein
VRGYPDAREDGDRLAEVTRVIEVDGFRIGIVHDPAWPSSSVQFTRGLHGGGAEQRAIRARRPLQQVEAREAPADERLGRLSHLEVLQVGLLGGQQVRERAANRALRGAVRGVELLIGELLANVAHPLGRPGTLLEEGLHRHGHPGAPFRPAWWRRRPRAIVRPSSGGLSKTIRTFSEAPSRRHRAGHYPSEAPSNPTAARRGRRLDRYAREWREMAECGYGLSH